MQGYCSGGTCQKFPVVLGEFGSRMRDCRNRCAAAGCMPLELSVSSSPFVATSAMGRTGRTCKQDCKGRCSLRSHRATEYGCCLLRSK